jgi:hypothetical protein
VFAISEEGMKNKFETVFVSAFLVLVVVSNACRLLSAPATPATPSALSAILSEIRGKVEIKPAGQDGFTSANSDSFLDENGQVQTGDDGRVRLDLSTGTIIRVAPTSLFTLISNESVDESLKTSLELMLGRLFIILNGGSLEVETPSGTAGVRGSYMMVEVDAATQDVLITCLEGNCSAENPAGSVNFTSGFRSILLHQDPVTGTYTIPVVTPMTDDDFQKWMDENIIEAGTFNQIATPAPAESTSGEAATAPPAP